MIRRIDVRPRADGDVDEYFAFLAEQSIEVAVRFHDATYETFELIAKSPGIGHPREVSSSRLAGLRSLAINGFPNHLVFYLIPDDSSILIVRVRHGAMDLDSVLMDDDE